MKVSLIERLMRYLGLSAGELQRDTNKTDQLREKLVTANAELSKARKDNTEAARSVIIGSFKSANRISEVRKTVQAVTARLEGDRRDDRKDS